MFSSFGLAVLTGSVQSTAWADTPSSMQGGVYLNPVAMLWVVVVSESVDTYVSVVEGCMLFSGLG